MKKIFPFSIIIVLVLVNIATAKLWVRSFFSDKSRLNKLSGIDLHKVQK